MGCEVEPRIESVFQLPIRDLSSRIGYELGGELLEGQMQALHIRHWPPAERQLWFGNG